jgi:hypothetical protein
MRSRALGPSNDARAVAPRVSSSAPQPPSRWHGAETDVERDALPRHNTARWYASGRPDGGSMREAGVSHVSRCWARRPPRSPCAEGRARTLWPRCDPQKPRRRAKPRRRGSEHLMARLAHPHRAKKPCREHQEGSHRRGDGSQGATDHRRFQHASPGEGSSPWQSGMRCRLTSAMCLTIVSTSTYGSPLAVLLPQGKGRVGQ